MSTSILYEAFFEIQMKLKSFFKPTNKLSINIKHEKAVKAQIVNEGGIITADVMIQGARIVKVAKRINDEAAEVIDLSGKF